MIKVNVVDKISNMEKKRAVRKANYDKLVLAATNAKKLIDRVEKEDGKKLNYELNRGLIACILDIGFEYQDITLIIGSLLKTKKVINGNDENAKMQLINECINLFNQTVKERKWELNGYKTAEDYTKKAEKDEAKE